MHGNHKIKTFKKGETEYTIMENHQFKKVYNKKAIPNGTDDLICRAGVQTQM